MKKNTVSPSWDDFFVSHEKSDSIVYFQAYQRYMEIYKQLPRHAQQILDADTDKRFLKVQLFKNVLEKNYKALFRKTPTANEALSALWMAKVSEAAKVKLINGNYAQFNGMTKKDLKKIAKLSINESLIIELPSILSEYGIILVYEQGFPSMKMDGVVFQLSGKNPVIGMSLRYGRLDYFWFTLLHELAHIVLHIDRLDSPLFDDLDEESIDLIEKEANRLAKNSFVERSVWRNCEPKYEPGDNAVYRFSKKAGIHPAVIAGLLRHERKNYEVYSRIINNIDIRKLVFGNE